MMGPPTIEANFFFVLPLRTCFFTKFYVLHDSFSEDFFIFKNLEITLSPVPFFLVKAVVTRF